MRLTKAKERALAVLADGQLLEIGLCVYRIQHRVIWSLEGLGLVKFSPYGKPPNWRITKAGREALAACSK